jgi:hypothetical protein
VFLSMCKVTDVRRIVALVAAGIEATSGGTCRLRHHRRGNEPAWFSICALPMKRS